MKLPMAFSLSKIWQVTKLALAAICNKKALDDVKAFQM
jgi:hypothetical protein